MKAFMLAAQLNTIPNAEVRIASILTGAAPTPLQPTNIAFNNEANCWIIEPPPLQPSKLVTNDLPERD